MGKIFPVILAVTGLAAGVGGGLALRPEPSEIAVEVSDTNAGTETRNVDVLPAAAEEPDYVKLNNQFVIPVVGEGTVTALVVISLSLELASGGPELVYRREPKLRDAFLQVLFNHANAGGFDGNFTSGRKMDELRSALRESAIRTLGPEVSDVLIADIVRQDV